MLPPDLRFRHSWRGYQERILADFERHLADGHFHVVAAPGSGKTVLGIEVVRRLGKPALVCAPTLALRAQWVERLSRQFLGGERPSWISEEVTAPGLLTFETYQALHALARKAGVRPLVERLREAGIGTLVFDEAHHLKQEWWRTLAALHRGLGGAFVVALTATPPYDVPQLEWNRYLTLAGSVDAEISAPELVLSGDLCPHQDYVYLQPPTRREVERVVAFEQGVSAFLGDLCFEREWLQALREHPALTDPEGRLDALLDEPEYALSLAVFLRHAEGVVPKPFLEGLGLEREVLPAFDAWWAERLLQGALFHDASSFASHEACLQALRERLQQLGALERRRVQLLSSAAADRALRASPAKLRAVADIIEAESRALGDGLRALVLTERIRDQAPRSEVASAVDRVGVVPIFDRLRRLRLPQVRLCAASGRVGIVPREMAEELGAALAASSPSPPPVTPLAHDASYSRVALAGDEPAAFVRLVTRALQQGRLTTIVATTALLGEGWDAPALNTLILATTIGSYVSTNQSRGRALRKDPEQPAKTANIWHPVCVDSRRVDLERGELALLERRFGAFMGPGLDSPTVESGIARLGLGKGELGPDALAMVNATMFRHAEDRARMAENWRRALLSEGPSRGRPLRETRLPRRLLPRVVIPYFRPGARLLGWIDRWRLRRQLTRIARALLEGLFDGRGLGPLPAELAFRVDVGQGQIAIRVLGLATREELLLHQALQQLFCPLFSPRYLLAGRQRTYAVPRVLGETREAAEALRDRWHRHLGRVRLVSTRTPEGKRLLLKTLERYLASHGRERIEARTQWFAGRGSGRSG